MTDTMTDGPWSGGHDWLTEKDDPGHGRIPRYGTPLWRRFYQSLLGDPVSGNQHLTGGVVAVGLIVPDFAMSTTVSVTGDTVRLSCDGSIATAANGLVVAVGTVFNITGRTSMKAASFFPNSAAAVLDIVYWD